VVDSWYNESMDNKFAPKLTIELKQVILKLHSEGFSNADIGRQIGVANTTVRTYLVSQGLESNKNVKVRPQVIENIKQLHTQGLNNNQIAEKVDLSGKWVGDILKQLGLTYNTDMTNREKVCEECNKTYYPMHGAKGYDIYRFCCQDCGTTFVVKNRQKYTQEALDTVLELKKQGTPNKKIQEITGININKIKEVCKANNILLTSEKRQQNAYEAKLALNPNAMQHLRESRMTTSCEDYENRLVALKQHVEMHGGTVTGEAEKFGINAKSVVLCFHNRGWSDLVSVADSSPQREVQVFVQSILPQDEILYSTRQIIKPFELDIYIPNKKVGIEFNGLFWHCSKNKHLVEGRHIHKFKKCEEIGIELFAIYEDEWSNKQDLVKKMIEHRLGVSKAKKIRASKLILKKYEKNEQFRNFFNNFHLDGHVQASYALGLEDKDGNILSCMSIRTNFNGEVEIARYANNYNYIVAGGFSRLLKHAPRPIISFSNNRLSLGNIYKINNFELMQDNPPSYWYTDLQSRVWRFKCKRNNDPEILSQYPTEQIQAANGVFSKEIFGDERPMWKIEDYGHKKWILK